MSPRFLVLCQGLSVYYLVPAASLQNCTGRVFRQSQFLDSDELRALAEHMKPTIAQLMREDALRLGNMKDAVSCDSSAA